MVKFMKVRIVVGILQSLTASTMSSCCPYFLVSLVSPLSSSCTRFWWVFVWSSCFENNLLAEHSQTFPCFPKWLCSSALYFYVKPNSFSIFSATLLFFRKTRRQFMVWPARENQFHLEIRNCVFLRTQYLTSRVREVKAVESAEQRGDVRSTFYAENTYAYRQ